MTSLDFLENNFKTNEEICENSALYFTSIFMRSFFNNRFLRFRILIQEFYNQYFKTRRQPVIPTLFTRFMNLLFALNFSNIFPCWYVNHNIQHLLPLIIFSNSLKTSTASSERFLLCFQCLD